MKNLKKPLCVLAMSVMLLPALVACGGKQLSETEKIVQLAQDMTYEELVAKAKEEVGDNVVHTYGNSSALVKALEAFTEKTGIKIENSKKGDSETYTELGQAFSTGKYVADMVLLQDGNKLQNEMMANDYLVNYIPKDVKDDIAEDDLAPTAAVYLNKVFMYNNTDYTGENGTAAKQHALTHYVTNVWQLAGSKEDEGHRSNISFKSPSVENVNMNFLVMLTSDAWVAKLTDAYKAFYGKDYVAEAQYPNIGYKWIAEFLKNTTPHDSDGTACKDLASGKSGGMCLVNFNKQKSLKSDAENNVPGKLGKDNITYPAIEEGDNFQGFGGFCYKMYAQVADNARYPYAACAIINYILSVEGFSDAWGTLAGYYSTNKKTPIADGDKELAWWKQKLVIEDPTYVGANYQDVFRFVQQYEGGNK